MKRLLPLLLVFLAACVHVQETPTPSIGPSAAYPPEAAPSLTAVLREKRTESFCGETVPLDQPAVREMLERELVMIVWDRPQVIMWLKRSGRCFPVITDMLYRQGLPADLKYVAVAESSLMAHAGSPKGAMGYWQFIKPTAKKYGLRVDEKMDERRSLMKSTEAAARYLADLKQRLGSWTLAAAGYNMGEEGLEGEIAVQKVHDYYQLYLPLETQRYLFRILAIKMVMENPARFGFDIAPADLYPPLSVDMVDARCLREAPVTLVAEAAHTTFRRIKELNPDIRGHYLPENVGRLLVPAGEGTGFCERYSRAFDSWLNLLDGKVVTVKAGDTLASIARENRVPLSAILIWNRLSADKPLSPGQKILIYFDPSRIQEQKETEAADKPIE
ncbi:MAG: transglycosylase SLT domain-containing protein [Thermodesulfobacteriota bacterium]